MENLSTLRDKDPIQILKSWLREAEEHTEIRQANVMVLSSFNTNSDGKHKVSSRVVLLKEIKKEDLIFYTNYNSLKSHQLKNPSALSFYWPALNKQIRLEGKTKRTNRDHSLQYWKTRTRESQISQYISKQSEKLENRHILKKKWKETQKKFYEKDIPCPSHWGGIAFSPNLIEFWMEKPHRLHERLLFVKNPVKKQWQSILLYP